MGGILLLSLVGWVGGGGSAVATGQEKVTECVEREVLKITHTITSYFLPVSIEMTGAARVELSKSPLLPTE